MHALNGACGRWRARYLRVLSDSVEPFEKGSKFLSTGSRARNESSPSGSGESRWRLVLSAQQAKVPEGIVSWRKLSSQLLQPRDNLCDCLHFLDLSLKDRSVRGRVIALCSAPHTGATVKAPDEQASGCNSRAKGGGFTRSVALGST